jgi:hypothetical protein
MLVAQPHGFAAETTEPLAMSKTLIVLKVDSKEPLPIRTSFQERPPTVEITFPEQRVVGSLPERSTVGKGIIQTIAARYSGRIGVSPKTERFLQSLQIVLSAPYAYRVWSEPGRVVVEIDHPASVSSADMEVGLRGGTIIGGLRKDRVSERFRAMQEALAQATPTPLTMKLTQELRGSSETVSSSLHAAKGQASTGPSQHLMQQPDRSASEGATPPAHASMPIPSRRAAPSPFFWAALSLSLVMAVGAALWLFSRREEVGAFIRRTTSHRRVSTRLPSGVVLIDQLVWRAFERQGFQLVIEQELIQPPIGTLRVILKDGIKMALLFVGHGPFFEKQTVERFVRAMREANVEQGILIASGSFTVPAQRLAKEHRVTLIGREQLIELLSTGAGSEYFMKQLEQQQARLEEAKATLLQYANELDTLRRQRNEASWYLGEERAKSAKLEAQLDELDQQLRRRKSDIQRWEQEASALRKRWEESQWYLGESQERVRHFETQLTALQAIAKRVETAERERADANWYLGEERTRSEALHTQLEDLRKHVEASASQEHALQDALAQLKQELRALRTFGERRSHARAKIPHAFVELHNGEEDPIFAGSPRDISGAGIGLETDQELPASLRVRLSFLNCESIESKAQLMWQKAEGQPTRYQSGCQLQDLSASTRKRLEQLVEESQSSRA